MAALTWRNVDAPDFRTALAGFAQSQQALSQAFDVAKNTVDEVDTDISKRVNTELQLQILNADTPEKAAAVTQALMTRPDADRINQQTIAAARERPTQLLQQAQLGLQNQAATKEMERADYGFGRLQQKHKWSDAAKPVWAQIIAESDPAKQDLIREANKEILGNVDLEELTAGFELGTNVAKAPLDYEALGLRNKGAKQDIDQSKVRFEQDVSRYERELRDENEARQANDLYLEFSDIGVDAVDFERHFNTNKGEYLKRGISTTALLLARAKVLAERGGLGSGDSGGGGGGAGQVTGDLSAIPTSVRQAATEVGSSLSSLGYNKTFVAAALGNFQVEGGYTGAKGDGGTAAGIAQWRNERRQNFVSLFGKDPSKATMAEQAKFVDWEFKNPGKAGMTVGQRDAILAAAQSGDVGRTAQLFDQFYERSDGKARQARVAAAANYAGLTYENARQLGATTSTNVDTNTDPLYRLGRFVKDNSMEGSTASVAAKLVDTTFKGEKLGGLETRIRELQDYYNIPAPIAGYILSEAKRGEGGFFSRFSHTKATFDESLIKRLGKAAQDRKGLLEQVGRADSTQRALAAGTAARNQEAQVAAAELQRQQRAAMLGRRAVPVPGGSRAQAAANMRSGVNDLLGEVANANRNTPETGNNNNGNGRGRGKQGAPNPGAKIAEALAPVRPAQAATLSESLRSRQFGKSRTYVPEGRFRTQEELDRYVGQQDRAFELKQSILNAAKGATRLGGVVGQRQRAAFVARFKMTPEEALQKYGR